MSVSKKLQINLIAPIQIIITFSTQMFEITPSTMSQPLIKLGKLTVVDEREFLTFDVDWPEPGTSYIGVGICGQIPIAGISRDDRSQAALDFLNGLRAYLTLEREPENRSDRSAIRVTAHWSSYGNDTRSEQIGYVPRDVAKTIKKIYPVGPLRARLRTAFLPDSERSIGLRIDIGRPTDAPEVVKVSAKKAAKQKKPQKLKNIKPILGMAEIEAILQVAQSTDSRACFDNQNMQRIDLSNRDLSGCSFVKCDLSGAILTGCKLRNANFACATMNDVTLEYSDLTGAILDSAHLETANLRGCNLHMATLRKTNLFGSDLTKAILTFAICTQAKFENAECDSAEFSNANLTKVKARDAGFCEAQFLKADLTRADMTNAELFHADLRGACLNETRFWQANLDSADLRDCDLTTAKLRGAWKDDTLTDEGYLFSEDWNRRNSPLHQAEKESRAIRELFGDKKTSRCWHCGEHIYSACHTCPRCGRSSRIG